MMNRLYPLWFLLLLGGCGRPAATSSDNEFDANGPGDSLYGARIPICGEFLGGYPVQVIGDRILMSNPNGTERNFSVYLLSGDSLKKEGEFLSRGRGPYEMRYGDVSFDAASRTLNMLATMNRENRFCRVKLDAIANLYDCSTWEYKPLSCLAGNWFMAFGLIDRSTYLMVGGNVDSLSMFSLFDVDKEQVHPLDFQLPIVDLDLSPLEQRMLWYGHLYKYPLGNRFLYLAQDFKYAFIFDLDGNNEINIVHYLSDELPKAHLSNSARHYSFDDSCETGFSSVAVDDRYIYVGYTQLTYGQRKALMKSGKAPWVDVNRINVYDWDGNFVRRLILDVAAGPMIVAGDQLIVKTTDPATAEDILVRYSL